MEEDKINLLLEQFPGSRRGANGVIVKLEDDSTFYITDVRRTDPDLINDEEMFLSVCSKNEIIRMREIRSAHDYLLRLRANTILDSPRFTRVMLERRKLFESKNRAWSLTEYYSSLNDAPKRYINRLPKKFREIARKTPFGFVPLTEANAICLRSLAGNIIIVSEAIRYFFYFMEICFYGRRLGLDKSCIEAGLIALRIMSGAESQDFDIDPRENISPVLRNRIQKEVDLMIEFTFAHEISHLVLGHTADIKNEITNLKDFELRTYYKNHEYEADTHAISSITHHREAAQQIADASLKVFLFLYLLELISMEIPRFPKFSVAETHPSSLDRIRNLIDSLPRYLQVSKSEYEDIISDLNKMRDILLQFSNLSSRDDFFSFYGSIHIRGLGGKPRRDRIDF